MSGLRTHRLVWCAADRRHALDPDPLVAERGEVATVLAPAEVGRALADVLAGLAERESGEVRLGAGGVALVPPGGALLPDLTVAANLALGLTVRSAADLRARVAVAARLLQVDGALDRYPDRLSAAQQLRAGLARALAAEPDLVVVEDRAGVPPCGPAVAAAADRVAVLVVTDDLSRVRPVLDRRWTAVELGRPRHRHRQQTRGAGDGAGQPPDRAGRARPGRARAARRLRGGPARHRPGRGGVERLGAGHLPAGAAPLHRQPAVGRLGGLPRRRHQHAARAGRVARAVAPDVAVLPQPGLVAAATARVEELPNLTPPGVSPRWRALASPGGGPPRGVWYKATHKSLVWYRPDVFRRYGVAPPTDWAELAAGRGRPSPPPGWRRCRSGAADGWVLTDWFENVLWGLDQVTYELLAGGARVLGLLLGASARWSCSPRCGRPAGALPGGPARALLTQFEDSVLDVAQRQRAAMVLGADFVLPVVRRLAPQAPPVDWFPVPAPPGGVAPVVVGGDLAVLLTGAGPGGRELVEWLARAEAARDWAAAGGFVSLRSDVTDYPVQYRPELLDQVRNGAPGGLGFDLSDQLVGRLSGGDGRGLWRLLQRFLAELGRGGETGRVVEDTVGQLVAAAGGGR